LTKSLFGCIVKLLFIQFRYNLLDIHHHLQHLHLDHQVVVEHWLVYLVVVHLLLRSHHHLRRYYNLVEVGAVVEVGVEVEVEVVDCMDMGYMDHSYKMVEVEVVVVVVDNSHLLLPKRTKERECMKNKIELEKK